MQIIGSKTVSIGFMEAGKDVGDMLGAILAGYGAGSIAAWSVVGSRLSYFLIRRGEA